MRIHLVTVLGVLLLAAFPGRSRADIIFSNLDVDDAYNPTVYRPVCAGAGCDGIFSGVTGLQESHAAAFAPGAQDIALETIELAVSLVGGPNELDVQLTSDSGAGTPGTVLEGWHLSGALPVSGTAAPPVALQSILHPLLHAETRYWVTVAVTDPQTAAGWYFNSTNDFGSVAVQGGSCNMSHALCFSDAGCGAETCSQDPAAPWSPSVGTLGGLRVTGGCINIGKGKVVVGKLATPPGDDTLTFQGTLTLPVPFSPPLDPLTDGVQVQIADAAGIVARVSIPGGDYSKTDRKGWTRNAKGTAWTYKDKNKTPAGGIYSVVMQDKSSSKPGLVSFTAKGKVGSYAVSSTDLPVHGLLVLGPPAGQCGGASFPGPAPAPRCSFNSKGTTLTCK